MGWERKPLCSHLRTIGSEDAFMKTAVTVKKSKKDWGLFLLILPFVVYLIMFRYVPLFGWYIGFVNYKIGTPIFKCEFVFLDNFKKLFELSAFKRAMTNTLIYSTINYATSLLPAVFAILLNEVGNKMFKKTVQTLTTIPHFISWVIVYGLCYGLFSKTGPVNAVLGLFGTSQKLLTDKDAVYAFQTFLGLWKSIGWSAIIYIAAISGIDQELYEAAAIDGAGYFKRAIHVTVPGIMPTMIVLLLLGISDFFSNGLDQKLIFANTVTQRKLTTIELYTYQQGIGKYDYSYSTAVGITMSIVSIILLFTTNAIAKKVRGTSIV